MRHTALVILFLVPMTIAADDDPFGPAVEPKPAAETENASGPNGPERANVRLQFDLVDGSRVIGTPVAGSEAITLRSHVGTFTVPFARLARVEVAPDRETTILHWSNGDRLTGFVDGEGIILGLLEGYTVADVAKSMKTSAYKVKKTFERLLEFVGRERE